MDNAQTSINTKLQFKGNPRKITENGIFLLENHLDRFGDLSGVVYCRNNKSYVGGNQRSKIFDGAKVVIVEEFDNPTTDGTVAFGFIVWRDRKFFYREVVFSESDFREACIAANKDGGEFDFEVLKEWKDDFMSQWDWDNDFFNQEPDFIDDEHEDDLPEVPTNPITKIGDIWQLGKHLLICGDSTKSETFKCLLENELPDMVFTDPPYNLPADKIGNKGKTKHKDFVNASGEMTANEFTDFLFSVFKNLTDFTRENSIHYVCMDWRHVREVLSAADQTNYLWKNLICWKKDIAGMGSFYNNKHELVFLFENGDGPYTKNFTYGTRSNVWEYPSANSLSSKRDSDDSGMLQEHPTPKPAQMVADAIADCSNPNEVIMDCFGGSGTTLIACEKTSRIARIIEFEPKYCDLIVARYKKYCERNDIEFVCLLNGNKFDNENLTK